MIAAVQYLIYFLVGTLYLFFIAAFFSVAAGFSIWAVVLLFLPIILAGYASGLSFFFPRAAAIFGLVLVLPFFLIGVYHIFAGAVGFNPMVMIAPAGVAILISVFTLLWGRVSVWARQEQLIGKVFIVIFTVLPALLATFLIASLLIRLSQFIYAPHNKSIVAIIACNQPDGTTPASKSDDAALSAISFCSMFSPIKPFW